jgi:hypothetical protein
MREYRLRLSDAKIFAIQRRLNFSDLAKNALLAYMLPRTQ